MNLEIPAELLDQVLLPLRKLPRGRYRLTLVGKARAATVEPIVYEGEMAWCRRGQQAGLVVGDVITSGITRILWRQGFKFILETQNSVYQLDLLEKLPDPI